MKSEKTELPWDCHPRTVFTVIQFAENNEVSSEIHTEGLLTKKNKIAFCFLQIGAYAKTSKFGELWSPRPATTLTLK